MSLSIPPIAPVPTQAPAVIPSVVSVEVVFVCADGGRRLIEISPFEGESLAARIIDRRRKHLQLMRFADVEVVPGTAMQTVLGVLTQDRLRGLVFPPEMAAIDIVREACGLEPFIKLQPPRDDGTAGGVEHDQEATATP